MYSDDQANICTRKKSPAEIKRECWKFFCFIIISRIFGQPKKTDNTQGYIQGAQHTIYLRSERSITQIKSLLNSQQIFAGFI